MTQNKQLSLGSRGCAGQMEREKPFRSRNTQKHVYIQIQIQKTNTNTQIEREKIFRSRNSHTIGKLATQ